MVICEVSFGCVTASMKKFTNAGIAGDVRSQDCFTSTLSKSSRKLTILELLQLQTPPSKGRLVGTARFHFPPFVLLWMCATTLICMFYDANALKIYVDGSALKNPGGPGGIAGIAEFPENLNRDNEVIFEEGYIETTNNRMELRACIRAFEHARQFAALLRCPRTIVISDSLYLNDNHHRAPYWKKNGWKNDDGKPVENVDLWNELLLLRPRVRTSTEIQWAKGKSAPILKEVDRRAKAAAKRPTNVDRGFRGGKVSRSKTPGRSASTLFSARGQESVINIYRKTLAGKIEDKIYFDLFSEDTGEFTAKYHAFTTAEIAHELHRSHRYRVRFNDNQKHPIIESVLEELVLAPGPGSDGEE